MVGPNFIRCANCDVFINYDIEGHLRGVRHRESLRKLFAAPSIDEGSRLVGLEEVEAVAAERRAAKTQRLEAKRRARTAAAETGGVGGVDAAGGRDEAAAKRPRTSDAPSGSGGGDSDGGVGGSVAEAAAAASTAA